MTQHAKLHLVYDGPALDRHEMDVRALAPALLALGDLLERANEILNGDQARVSVRVQASFKSGSFGVDLSLVQSLWQQLLNVGNSPAVTSILSLAGLLSLTGSAGLGAIHLIKWLRARPITKITARDDGTVEIWVDNDMIKVEDRVLLLVRDYKIRRAIEDVIAKPLEAEGVESFSVVDAEVKDVVVHVQRSERAFFKAPPPIEEQLEPEEYEANLQILTLAFQDGNKWRFSDGGSSFYATVLDDEFINRVRLNQEAFSKDDLIRARVRRSQRLVPGEGLRADFEVLKVIEHRSASPKIQLRLSLDPPESDRGA